MAAKTAPDPSTLVTETILAGVKQGQELAFTGLSAWADVAGKAFSLPAFESFPGFESLPGLESLPTPKSFIEASFGFAEEMLASQKEFALKVLDAMPMPEAKAPKA
jgi:hypothetical protein